MPSSYFAGLGEMCLETFKETVKASYLSQEPLAQPIEVDVIYNASHQDKDYNGIAYGAPRPVAWFKTGLITPKYGDQVTIDAIIYIINEIRDDGLELTQLGLTAP